MEKYDLIIVGAGPAGIFTAVELLRRGSKKHILLVEKGKPVEKRHCPKAELGHCVNCRPTCAITTGFSGAGAFSDGKLSLSYEVGGDLPSLIGEEFAQELIDYTDKIYLEFGADPHVEGIYTGEDIKEIRKNAIHAGLKLVDCPIRHLGTEKAQQLYLAIQNYLADAGVDVCRLCFTSRAPTPLLFRGGGGALPCRTRSADLLYSAGQLGEGWAADAGALALSSACLVDSPCRFTHLSALDTAHASGVPVCFVPALRPALWPSEKTLRDTVLQFLPFADLLVLTEDEMELLLDTRAYQVGLFFLLRGHVQLVLLQTAEGVHAFTRTAHAFWPGLSAPPEELAARLLFRLDAQDAALKKLMKYSAAALQTLL